MSLERMQSWHLTGDWLGVSYGWIMPVPLLPFMLCKWIAMLVRHKSLLSPTFTCFIWGIRKTSVETCQDRKLLSDIEEKKQLSKFSKTFQHCWTIMAVQLGNVKKPRTKIGLLPLRCNQCELAFSHVEHEMSESLILQAPNHPFQHFSRFKLNIVQN